VAGGEEGLVWNERFLKFLNMNRKYAGAWTALITPFKKDGSLDEEALRGLVKRQIEGGVTGITPVGTTGESPTTTMEEDVRIFEIVCEERDKAAADGLGEVMVMAGTGSNCTRDAVKYTENAKKAGCDLCLVVAPYYNKPTPSGLLAHYRAVADVGLPVIVYNIKGRSGINIETDVLMKIAAHPNVVGVKEASGNMEQMKEVIASRPDDFVVLSGDDGLTLELIQNGGDGVVSVASNIVPDKLSEMVEYALMGNMEEAGKIGAYLARMFEEMFVETNPIPVKYAAALMGLCEPIYRLPMCEPTEEGKKVVEALVNDYNLKNE
jgi:4-hydroxy-tetrahydrodipicolinate synthase